MQRNRLIAGALVALALLGLACGPGENNRTQGTPSKQPGSTAGPALFPPHAADNLTSPRPGDHVLAVTIRAFTPVEGGLGDMHEDVVPMIISVTARNGDNVPLLGDDFRPMLDWTIREPSPLKIPLSQPPKDTTGVIKADVWIRSESAPADTIFKCYWEVDGVPVLTQVTQRLGSFEGKGAPCRHTIKFV